MIDSSSNPRLGYYGTGTIDVAVKKILEDNDLPYLPKNIEKSRTVDKVEGKNETPIDLVFHLCKQTKPIKGASPESGIEIHSPLSSSHKNLFLQ